MTTAIAERSNGIDPSVVEQVLIKGDLRGLTPQQKVSYVRAVCDSVGINYLTTPFKYIVLNGKEVLYASKDATEQLRKVHHISIDPKGFTREVIEGCYVVTAPASTPEGRTDVSTGVVAIDGLKGEARANAMMKAETKAKRRVTLSICGLGMLDESETETLPVGPVIVEVPPQVRAPLPPGAFYIVKAEVKQFGGDITLLDEHGEEKTYPTPDRQCAELCEQIAQENPAVPVLVQRVIGARDKKEKIKSVNRWTSAPKPAPAVATEADVL